MQKISLLLAAALLVSPIGSFAGEEADALVGVWSTAEGRAQVQITKKGDSYYGKIVSVKEPRYPVDDKQGMAGLPKIDRENPDAGLRARSILGLEILQDLKYAGDKRWTSGQVYDPETGNTYACEIYLASDNKLNLRGFLFFSGLGRTQVWTKPIPQLGNR